MAVVCFRAQRSAQPRERGVTLHLALLPLIKYLGEYLHLECKSNPPPVHSYAVCKRSVVASPQPLSDRPVRLILEEAGYAWREPPLCGQGHGTHMRRDHKLAARGGIVRSRRAAATNSTSSALSPLPSASAVSLPARRRRWRWRWPQAEPAANSGGRPG